MTKPNDDAVAIAQAWQGHRQRCVELAISAGTPIQDVVTRADEISKFIITKSEFETKGSKTSSTSDDSLTDPSTMPLEGRE